MDMLHLHWPATSATAPICLTALVCMLHFVHAQVRCFSSNDIVGLIPLLMGLTLLPALPWIKVEEWSIPRFATPTTVGFDYGFIPLFMGFGLHTSQSMRFVDPALP